MIEGAILLHQHDDVLNVVDGAALVMRRNRERTLNTGRKCPEHGDRTYGARRITQELTPI
jgi:hypothetical protein